MNIDFFIYWVSLNFYILPTIVVYNNKKEFLETGVYSPCWGVSICWLTFGIGIKVQKTH